MFLIRVSSKQQNVFFGSNRSKAKLNLLFFRLFRKTKKHFFRFVSVYFGVSDFVETYRKNLQKTFSIRESSK
jgi:hypothetical protein